MANKTVFQINTRQILVIALISALAAALVTALLFNFGVLWRSNNGSIALAEQAPPADLSDPATVSDEQNNIEIYRALSPGVAFITSTTYRADFWGGVEEGQGSGSGSVIDNQGHILTNYHVIEGAQKLTVSLGGDKIFPATVVGGDPDTDLAVIKIDPPREGLTIISMSDSDRLVIGQKVLAIGNPFGLDRTLTTGIISGLQRPIRARNGRPIEGAIQTDASINPGNSGGPLLDKYGKMIGINSQILSPAGGSVGVGFAIPANIAKRVVPQLIQFGEVRRPKLGVATERIERLMRRGYRLPVEKGLVVFQTMPGGAAAIAGIRGLSSDGEGYLLGDIITAIDGTEVNSDDDIFRALDKKQIGDTVQIEVYRSGKTVTIPVKLTPPPAQRQSVRQRE
ncbi:MAG: trypsin-like peptidase domain-containing protein [Pyrinomonadaceae bacterium]|nr:trypsin-like peptidase domain-containing protein [Pyrinomonadaceae bacterium]